MNTKPNSHNSGKLTKIVLALSFILIISLFSQNSYSTSISSVSSGGWSSKSTWNLGRVPISTDDVYINNAVNVNVNGVVIASLTINSSNAFSLDKGTDLTINGNLMNNGSITINNSSTEITSITLKGNFTNNSGATFSETGSNERFYFSGTTTQTFTNNGTISATMYDLTLNNTAGLNILSNITVGGTINMIHGNINLNTGSGYILTLGTSTSNRGTLNYTSGQIITGINGGFKRWFAASTISNVIFPLGTSNNLNKITLSFTTAPTAGGTLSGKYISLDPGTSSYAPITDGSYTVNTYSPTGYWQIDNSGITSGIYTVGLEGQGFNVGGTSILNYQALRVIKRLAAGNNWQVLGTHMNGTGTNSDPTALRTGLSGFSQFTFGGNTADNPFAGPLPVELTSFSSSVKDRNVNLFWTTSSEQNNSGFQIERTVSNTNNNNWINVGFVKGKNNSNTLNHYSYSDEKLQTGKYQYRLKQVDFNGNFKYYELNNIVEIGVPSKFNLSQNYPNPFNPTTKIDYDLPSDSKVSIKVYDIMGREIMSLVNASQTAGNYTVQLNATNIASGVYFYRLIASSNGTDNVITKKMNVIK
jgi:hypothetical protein